LNDRLGDGDDLKLCFWIVALAEVIDVIVGEGVAEDHTYFRFASDDFARFAANDQARGLKRAPQVFDRMVFEKAVILDEAEFDRVGPRFGGDAKGGHGCLGRVLLHGAVRPGCYPDATPQKTKKACIAASL
jgi:hypothetical protein